MALVGLIPSQSKLHTKAESLIFCRPLFFEVLNVHLISPALSEGRQAGWQCTAGIEGAEEVEHKLQNIVWTGSMCHQV